MSELLLELFSEEIPAGLQARAVESITRLVTSYLEEVSLTYTRAQGYATPRRITLVVEGIPDMQENASEERRGPRVDAPNKAIEGFLKSVGLRRDQVQERVTAKGKFIFALVENETQATPEILAAAMPELIAQVGWPRSMRWGTSKARWVRPLHSIICLFDTKVVPFCYAGVQSGSMTFGHRFHAPDSITVEHFKSYCSKLESAYVRLDSRERCDLIRNHAAQLASHEGLVTKIDDALLNEIAGLVEWPVLLIGRVDEDFMTLPPEVLLASIRHHQKYIALYKKDGSLAPRFIVVSNIEATDGGLAIVSGNERVLRARLADAQFFFSQDRKSTLASQAERLSRVVFHARLGTIAQKVVRMQAIAELLCESIPGINKDYVGRAAQLSKADLVTNMVSEFPELQGIMGGYYAQADGAPREVSIAVAEHYSPQGPSDKCPQNPVSIALALADKIDTVVGFWLINEKPTGSGDPFGLRRAVLGIIRLITENKVQIGLADIFNKMESLYMDSGIPGDEAAISNLLDFVGERFRIHLRNQGMRHDLIAALFGFSGEDSLSRILTRVDALEAFLDTDAGSNLLVAYKRASNIVAIEEKKDACTYDGMPTINSFVVDEERDLHESLTNVFESSARAIENENFVEAMRLLAELRPPIDKFFSAVRVNADKAAIRENRLKLLSQIRTTFNQVADFAQIEG